MGKINLRIKGYLWFFMILFSMINICCAQLKLIDFEYEDWDPDSFVVKDKHRYRAPRTPQIIERRINSGILTIKIVDMPVCYDSYKGKIEVRGNTINLKVIEMGHQMDCMLFYVFTYKIKGVSRDNYKIQLDGRDIEYGLVNSK